MTGENILGVLTAECNDSLVMDRFSRGVLVPAGSRGATRARNEAVLFLALSGMPWGTMGHGGCGVEEVRGGRGSKFEIRRGCGRMGRPRQATPCVEVMEGFRMTLAGVPINHAGAHLNLTGCCPQAGMTPVSGRLVQGRHARVRGEVRRAAGQRCGWVSHAGHGPQWRGAIRSFRESINRGKRGGRPCSRPCSQPCSHAALVVEE